MSVPSWCRAHALQSSEVAAAVLRDTPEKEYVFHISEEEAKVVATTANTLLLGRSGTGTV